MQTHAARAPDRSSCEIARSSPFPSSGQVKYVCSPFVVRRPQPQAARASILFHILFPPCRRRPRRRRIKIHSTKERTRKLFTTESPTPERRLREECLSALAWRERSSSTSSAKEESPIFLSLCYELSGKPSPSKIGAFRLTVYLQCNHYRARLGSSQIARIEKGKTSLPVK